MEYFSITKFESSMPVHKAFFLSEKYLIYSTKDRNTYIVDIPAQKQYKASYNGDYINAAFLTPDGTHIVEAFNNGNLYAVPVANLGAKTAHNHNFVSKIIDICECGNNGVYVLLHSGELIKYDISTGSTKTILGDKRVNASALANITDKNLLAVCFANGNIHFVNTLTDTKVEGEMLGGHSSLEKMVYNPRTQILALTSADKRVSFINTKDLNAKPLAIEEHSLNDNKVRCIDFNSKGM